MTRCVGVRPGRWLRSVWSVAHASGSFHVCLCMLSMSLMVVSANVNASACVSISSLLVSATRTPVYMTRSSPRVRSGSDEQPKHAVEEARSGSAFPTHPFWLKHRSALARFSGHVSRLPSSVLSCFFSVVISSVSAQSLRHPAFVYPRNPAMLVMVHATSSRLRLPPALPHFSLQPHRHQLISQRHKTPSHLLLLQMSMMIHPPLTSSTTPPLPSRRSPHPSYSDMHRTHNPITSHPSSRSYLSRIACP